MQPREVGLPVHAYVAQEQVKPEGTEKAQQVFVHLPTTVSQTEAEEIGVEHLLRDVKDATISTLSTDIVSQAQVSPVHCCVFGCVPMLVWNGMFETFSTVLSQTQKLHQVRSRRQVEPMAFEFSGHACPARAVGRMVVQRPPEAPSHCTSMRQSPGEMQVSYLCICTDPSTCDGTLVPFE